MKVAETIRTIKENIQAAPDRIALRILLWLEKEPSQERLPLPAETGLAGSHTRVERGKKENAA